MGLTLQSRLRLRTREAAPCPGPHITNLGWQSRQVMDSLLSKWIGWHRDRGIEPRLESTRRNGGEKVAGATRRPLVTTPVCHIFSAVFLLGARSTRPEHGQVNLIDAYQPEQVFQSMLANGTRWPSDRTTNATVGGCNLDYHSDGKVPRVHGFTTDPHHPRCMLPEALGHFVLSQYKSRQQAITTNESRRGGPAFRPAPAVRSSGFPRLPGMGRPHARMRRRVVARRKRGIAVAEYEQVL